LSSSSQSGFGIAAPVGATSDGPTITAIPKPPYMNWLDIQQIVPPTATVPDEDSTSSTPTASCTASRTGIDPGIANELAKIFCNGTDLAISENWDIGGYSLNPPISITSGIYIHFNYTALDGDCGLSCVDSYSTMIKTYKLTYFLHLFCVALTSNNGPGQGDNNAVYGVASLADACGTYAMTVTGGGIVGGPTA